jgi:small subunit ribosomal protein S6
MLKRYETLLLLNTKATEDEISAIERQFDQILTNHEGKMLSFDKWGKYKLAFPVKTLTYGYYILVRYEAEALKVSSLTQELNTFIKIKCNDIIMRFTNVVIPTNAPLVYNKPESIDAIRTGGVDAFLKENKMESLLGGTANNGGNTVEIEDELAAENASEEKVQA